jgi:hypothetical protein
MHGEAPAEVDRSTGRQRLKNHTMSSHLAHVECNFPPLYPGRIPRLAFWVHALRPLPPADSVAVPPVQLLVARFAANLRNGGPRARCRYLQALTAPATKPVYQACCFPAERAITSSRLRHSLSFTLNSLESIIAGRIAGRWGGYARGQTSGHRL